MLNRFAQNAAIGAAKIVVPYVFLPGHVKDIGEKWSNGHKCEAIFKGVTMSAGAVIGLAVSIPFSPQLYKAFWSASNSVNNARGSYDTEAETPLGVKIEAGFWTGLVDAWAASLVTEVSAEIADGFIASTHGLSRCASSLFGRVQQPAQNSHEVQNQPIASIV